MNCLFKNLTKMNFKKIFNFTIFIYNNFSLRHINIRYMYSILLFCLFDWIFHSYCSIILYFIYWWQHLRPSSNYTNNRREDILCSPLDFYFFFLIFLTFLCKDIYFFPHVKKHFHIKYNFFKVFIIIFYYIRILKISNKGY